MRDNILNMNVFKTCLERNMVNHVISITDSVIYNNKYNDLAMILCELDFNVVKIYSNILIDKNDRMLDTILLFFWNNAFTRLDDDEEVSYGDDVYPDDEEVSYGDDVYPDDKYIESFNNILISLFITKYEDKNKLNLLKEYIQCGDHTNIINQINDMDIEKKELDNFIENINFIGAWPEYISKLEKSTKE